MAYLLVLTSLITYSGTFYLNYLNYNWFPCNLYTNIINSVAIGLITILTVSGLAKNGSLITSGAMSFYITF